jgi:hypothetical protein
MFKSMGKGMINFIRRNWKTISILLGLILFVAIAQRLGIDEKAIVILVLFVGYVTQAFTIIVGLIAAIPIIGPPVAYIVSLPFFLIVNALAYLITLFTLRKGYTKDVLGSRILVTAFLIGIIIGYALGKLL